MFSARTFTLAALLLVPVLVYLGLGGYALWQTGLFRWTWWIIPGCWGVTWLLACLWRPRDAVTAAELPRSRHWTPRDEEAAAILRRFQERVDGYSPKELTDPQFYLDRARELAGELARHYHPRSSDPLTALTVPEVLAAVRLAVDDMESWMLESVPGSRLLTIQQWRWLGQSPKWLRRVRDAAWATSILVNPLNLVKFFTSKLTLEPVSKELQAEFLAAVYLRFIRQTGFYLIEMNSGRLRGGADRYREAFGNDDSDRRESGSKGQDHGTGEDRERGRPGDARSAADTDAASLAVESLAIAVVGQVKAGKSSLVNLLIGDRVAASDVLPLTKAVTRYHLPLAETGVELTLLDTPGYADAGATKAQLAEVAQAVRNADVVLLVLAAHAPARAADRRLVDELLDHYRQRRELKPPPVIICLTHIDLLSPVLEWAPPYDWRTADDPKSRSIREAVAYARETFADLRAEVVPVCTDVERDRASNVIEELLPALTAVLGEGQTAALLRAYHRNLDRDHVKLLLKQLKSSGKLLLNLWLEERFSRRPS